MPHPPQIMKGEFMGLSCITYKMVGLIINLTIQKIYPKFHIVFNDMFTTIISNNDDVVPII